jgi:hypothetical protein
VSDEVSQIKATTNPAMATAIAIMIITAIRRFFMQKLPKRTN